MTPTTTGTTTHTTRTTASAPGVPYPPPITAVRLIPRQMMLAMAELDGWDAELVTLNQALRDRASARDLLADAERAVELARERCRLRRAAIMVQLADGAGR